LSLNTSLVQYQPSLINCYHPQSSTRARHQEKEKKKKRKEKKEWRKQESSVFLLSDISTWESLKKSVTQPKKKSVSRSRFKGYSIQASQFQRTQVCADEFLFFLSPHTHAFETHTSAVFLVKASQLFFS
jgi:hypothetical protein